MGGKTPGDVIWTDESLLIAAQWVLDLMREAGFTGWTTFPVVVLAKDGSPVPGYSGFAVTGRCGPVTVDRSNLIEPERGPAMYQGLTFDPATWDGSDIFRVNLGPPLVLAPVKEALERAKVRNLRFTPLAEVKRPKFSVDRLDGTGSGEP
jgi:hypothetical protein